MQVVAGSNGILDMVETEAATENVMDSEAADRE
jgi:hypothetical protein